MADITVVVTLLNAAGFGGLGIFIYYVVKGLRERIQSLTDLAVEQSKTLEVVRTRALELDQLRKDYKQALDDFQDIGHKLEERRNAVIRELEVANREKDNELARLKKLELEEIDLKKKSLERLPDLEQRLATTIEELARQIRVVAEGSSIHVEAKPRDTHFATWLSTWDSPTLHVSAGPGSGKAELNRLVLSYLLRHRPATNWSWDFATPNQQGITLSQFLAADIRVGEILRAERTTKSKKIVKLVVAVGEGDRVIVSTLGALYDAHELIGRKILVVTNLEPATVMGIESHGLVLSARVNEEFVLLSVDPSFAAGTRVG